METRTFWFPGFEAKLDSYYLNRIDIILKAQCVILLVLSVNNGTPGVGQQIGGGINRPAPSPPVGISSKCAFRTIVMLILSLSFLSSIAGKTFIPRHLRSIISCSIAVLSKKNDNIGSSPNRNVSLNKSMASCSLSASAHKSLSLVRFDIVVKVRLKNMNK
jgi:hypothetical protein